jgi:hypothetical protein
MTNSKKKTFHRVYVLANGSRNAHNASNDCGIDPRNFHYLTNISLIKHLNDALFLMTDSFSNNRNKQLILNELDQLKEKTLLTTNEFKENISYAKADNFKQLKRLTKIQ